MNPWPILRLIFDWRRWPEVARDVPRMKAWMAS
jgi:hypothetical protein